MDTHFKPIQDTKKDLVDEFFLFDLVLDDSIPQFCDIEGCDNEVKLSKKLGKNVNKILCPYHFQLKKHSKRKNIGLKYHTLKKKYDQSRKTPSPSHSNAQISYNIRKEIEFGIRNTKTGEYVQSKSSYRFDINAKYNELKKICKSFCDNKITSEDAKKKLSIFLSKN